MKFIKYVAKVYKNGFSACGQGDKHIMVVNMLRMVAITISLITAIIGIVKCFASGGENHTGIMYTGFQFKVVLWLTVIMSVLNVYRRLKKENKIGKIKLLMLTVMSNVLVALSTDFDGILAVGVGLVKLVALPIAIISGPIFFIVELSKMSSVEDEYESIKEPMKVLMSHMTGFTLMIFFVQLMIVAVKVAITIILIMIIFSGMSFASSLAGALGGTTGESAGESSYNPAGKGSGKAKRNDKLMSGIEKNNRTIKDLERALEGKRRGEIGYFGNDVKATERRIAKLKNDNKISERMMMQ